MADPDAGVALQGLAHAYDGVAALHPLQLAVKPGETLGLLGPNGAGKTTTLRLLATLLAPTGGDANVFGWSLAREPARVRARVGLVPQEISLYRELSADENLRFFARLNGVAKGELASRCDALLERVGLRGRRSDPVRTFSGGMQRRLNLACSLVHEPRLLLLDEPTVGVDPQSRESLFDVVRALAAEGTTIVYTTHYMEEAERLCDRVAILDQGRMIALGTQAELVELAKGAAPPAPPRVDLGRVFMHLTGRELRD